MKKFVCMLFLCVSCGIFAQDSPGIYTVENVKINTPHSDFGTAFLGKDKVVFAAPRDGFTLNREEYKGQPFLDLHVAEVSEDGKLIRKQKLPGDVNTKYHEGMVTFSKDMKTVYFSANGKIKRVKRKKDKDRDNEVKTKGTANIHLFKASIDENGDWGNLEMLPFNDDRYSTGHPVLNWDDSKLYFVSDSPESLGRTDIFVVDIYEDGTYGEPINLGPKINTQEREMFPFIGMDNVLYFSSDGFAGFGELDVYASKIFDNTVSDPINLEAPVNSISDDFAYIIDDQKHKGYFSSNREGGRGDDDIYSFTASPPIYIECQQEITGVVKNIDTQELIPNVTIILFDKEGEKLQSFMSNEEEAAFSFMQSCNSSFKIQGFLEGYLVGEMDIQTVNDLNAEPIEIVLNMTVDPDLAPDTIVETTQFDDTEAENKDAEANSITAAETDNSSAAVVAVVATDHNNNETELKEADQTNPSQIAAKEDAISSTETASSATVAAADTAKDKENEKNLITAVEDANSSSVTATGTNNSTAGEISDSVVSNTEVTSVDRSNPDSSSEVAKTATAASSSKATSSSSSNAGKTSAAVIAAAAVVSGADNENTAETQVEESDIAQTVETSQLPDSKEKEVNEDGSIAANSAIASTPVAAANTQNQDTKGSQVATTEQEVANSNKSEEQAALSENTIVSDGQAITSSESAQQNEALTTSSISEEAKSDELETETAVAANSKNVSQPDLALNYQQTHIDLEGLNINTIYFDFDKSQIRYDAKIELNKLVKVMKEYPEMKIEVNAHTDIRGKKKYNDGLSNKRADATTKYLIENGVESKRIASYWFGERRPAEKCSKESPCSGFQHQLNRRSEFSIINKSSEEVIVKSVNRKNTMNQKEDSYTSNSGLFMNYNFYEDTQVYTVQIGAFKGQVQTDKYSKLTDLFNHRYDDGLNRYYSGIFETSTEARNHMKRMRKNGYVGAFVVGLKGENRF
ncbi:OmpA family protein [Lutimonas halocynthiae]|uniref:OmpA family protein n=1 Tax=Lutimonas halocynthiae TaxID=1446477 RepID=UPI0025B2C66F|nr:OmpA family protein [Lutimonas halocynthiae]MDN3642021.1 OmpA family protein [Lutimonas halocynthiae]